MLVNLEGLPPGAAQAASAAIGPDNVQFPAGQSLDVRVDDDTLHLEFRADGSIASLACTVDEVLSHVQASVGVTKC